MALCLTAVAEQLLKDVQRAYSEKSQTFYGALDLVDQRSVTRVSSPSGRVAFQVLGGSGCLYTCYTSCHYCSCPAFSFSVLRRNESLVVSFSSSFRQENSTVQLAEIRMISKNDHGHIHIFFNKSLT
uniref:Zinc finger, SWIM-type containing 7 n=1 Tax=Astyanax mexicanus TaxID=7994 RepID=W5L3A8_ASTMX